MSISEFSDSSSHITLTVSASRTDTISELKSAFNPEVRLAEISEETHQVEPSSLSEFSEL